MPDNDAAAPADPVDAAKVPRTIAFYTGARFIMFLGAFGVCLVLGLETPISIVLAFVVSSLASFVLLRRQRDALAAGLMVRRERKVAAKARRRDALDEG
jgi:hypothetical protein